MDLRLKLSRAEDAPTLSGVKPPEVAVADHDHMPVAARVALFGVRHAPVETLGSRNARTVEHPPGLPVNKYAIEMGLKTNRYVSMQNGVSFVPSASTSPRFKARR